jgi:hypothetical protein
VQFPSKAGHQQETELDKVSLKNSGNKALSNESL